MEDVIIPLVAILCAVGLPLLLAILICVKSIQSKHEERMAMIEKGIILEEPEKKANRYSALRNGLFMIGIALGILIGLFVQSDFPLVDNYYNITVPTMAILFGGIAFVIYFFFSRKMQEKENRQN